jgi:hypothetical protein
MARTKTWAKKVLEALGTESSVDWPTQLKGLTGTRKAAQDRILGQLDLGARHTLLRAVLAARGYRPDNRVTDTSKFHDVMLRYYVDNPDKLTDLDNWSSKYLKAPHFKPSPSDDQRVPLASLIKTKKGMLRNPVASMYRTMRGNAFLNESKDLVGRLYDTWDPQVSTLLSKLVKNDYIKYDPLSGTVLIPRNVIRQIDPYYEKYQETLSTLADAAYNESDRALGSGIIDRILNGAATSPEDKRYVEMAKDLVKAQIRANMHQFDDEVPMEERERLIAQNEELLNAEPDADSLARALTLALVGSGSIKSNETIDPDTLALTANGHATARHKLASVFSEKGLRSLLNNPKRAAKLSQVLEFLEDKWLDIVSGDTNMRWHPGDRRNNPEDRALAPFAEVIPNYDALGRYASPGGNWKTMQELQSLNNYDTLRRRLVDNKRQAELNREQARTRVLQYIQEHPELRALAEQNALEEAARRGRAGVRGIGYTPNAEDEEEQALLQRVPSGNYSTKVKNILANPRLAELAERPYQYSKEIQAVVTIPTTNQTPWRLARNRRDLYNRSLNHNICVGVPVHGYHDQILQKKSLIFLHGVDEDTASETGEISLWINPATHVIVKAYVHQVHGMNNASGTKAATNDLEQIAQQLIGKNISDANNVVEQHDIVYKEEDDRAQDPAAVFHDAVDDYAVDHGFNADDVLPDEAYDHAHRHMMNLGYHVDDDGNYLAPNDPRYNDWDEDGNRIEREDEGELDDDDPGYVGGGYVEPLGNPAYQRLLELLLEDGMTKPATHITASIIRRF